MMSELGNKKKNFEVIKIVEKSSSETEEDEGSEEEEKVGNAAAPQDDSLDSSSKNSWESRFKIVRILPSGKYQRGRWLCEDYAEPPEKFYEEFGDGFAIDARSYWSEKDNAKVEFFLQGGPSTEEKPIGDLVHSPLESTPIFNDVERLVKLGEDCKPENFFVDGLLTKSLNAHDAKDDPTSRACRSVEEAIRFLRNIILQVVHTEVDPLREKVQTLLARLHELEKENCLLKASASYDVLRELSMNETGEGRGNDVSSMLSIDLHKKSREFIIG